MRLDKCKFVANVTVEQVENCLQLWQQSFPQYQLTFEKPSYFNEIQDNPDPKNFRDDTIFIHRDADCKVSFSLKNARHNNWDFCFILYQNNLYFGSGVYYYAHYISDQAYALFADHNFKIKTYKNWVDAHSDQKFAQHNYKIDQEDLAKIPINV